MKDQIRRELDETILKEIQAVDEIESGTKTKSDAVADLGRLYNLRLEEMKIEESKADRALKAEQMAVEAEKAEATLMSESKSRKLRLVADIGLAVGGWIAYDIWFNRGLKFEMEGTVTNPWTRGLIGKLLPKK